MYFPLSPFGVKHYLYQKYVLFFVYSVYAAAANSTADQQFCTLF